MLVGLVFNETKRTSNLTVRAETGIPRMADGVEVLCSLKFFSVRTESGYSSHASYHWRALWAF